MPLSESADADPAYVEAVRVVFGELERLPYIPEMPGRGAIASMTGRALAVVTELGADLQPAGWRLTDAAGVDQRRARSLLAQDLDRVEEVADGYQGELKAQIAGPWTLAATVERPRGDKILADHGARRELAQALAEGLRGHVADLRRRLPRVQRLIVQVDEPALPAVLAARVPTASGFGKHRAIDLPEASAALEWVFAAITDAGAEPWLHSCAPDVPWGLVRKAGAVGLSADLGLLGSGGHDQLAESLDAGGTVALGVVPATDPETPLGDRQTTERVQRWLDLVGFDPLEVSDRLVVTPTCGLAGATPAWARRALVLSRQTAANLDRS